MSNTFFAKKIYSNWWRRKMYILFTIHVNGEPSQCAVSVCTCSRLWNHTGHKREKGLQYVFPLCASSVGSRSHICTRKHHTDRKGLRSVSVLCVSSTGTHFPQHVDTHRIEKLLWDVLFFDVFPRDIYSLQRSRRGRIESSRWNVLLTRAVSIYKYSAPPSHTLDNGKPCVGCWCDFSLLCNLCLWSRKCDTSMLFHHYAELLSAFARCILELALC